MELEITNQAMEVILESLQHYIDYLTESAKDCSDPKARRIFEKSLQQALSVYIQLDNINTLQP